MNEKQEAQLRTASVEIFVINYLRARRISNWRATIRNSWSAGSCRPAHIHVNMQAYRKATECFTVITYLIRTGTVLVHVCCSFAVSVIGKCCCTCTASNDDDSNLQSQAFPGIFDGEFHQF
jgi:hypothetical protein